MTRAPLHTHLLTEKEWQGQVVQLARTLGWRHYHTYRSTRSPSGWPDLALCRDRLVLLELKTAHGKVSAAQADWIRALHHAGAEIYVARPRHLQTLATLLGPHGTLHWHEARGHLLLELDPILDHAHKEHL